jgi:2-polyprenyl-3-methyl-5-hydroxy-6-metoxy-1,4-benzoquinol methylase
MIQEGSVSLEEMKKQLFGNSGTVVIDERLPIVKQLEQPISYRFEWAINQIVGTGLNICDVGCGTSVLPTLLYRSGHTVTAVDSDVEAIQQQHDTTPLINVVVSNILDIDMSDTYDVVTSLEVLEHIQDTHSYISKLFSMTKINGLIILTTPILRNYYVKEHVHFFNYYDIDRLCRLYTDEYIVVKLNKFMAHNRSKTLFGIVMKKTGKTGDRK